MRSILDDGLGGEQTSIFIKYFNMILFAKDCMETCRINIYYLILIDKFTVKGGTLPGLKWISML